MKKLLLPTLALLLISACTSSTEKILKENPIAETATQASSCPVEEPYKSDLINTTWRPVFLKDQENAPMPNGKEDGFVYIRFNDKLEVNGMSGDNLFGGSVIISKNGSFRALNLFSTRRMGKFSAYEYKFMQALHKANRIYISSSAKTMKLMNGDTTLLEFVKTEHIKDK